jgi:hypothetical protein
LTPTYIDPDRFRHWEHQRLLQDIAAVKADIDHLRRYAAFSADTSSVAVNSP